MRVNALSSHHDNCLGRIKFGWLKRSRGTYTRNWTKYQVESESEKACNYLGIIILIQLELMFIEHLLCARLFSQHFI